MRTKHTIPNIVLPKILGVQYEILSCKSQPPSVEFARTAAEFARGAAEFAR
jgi:hypothetical protein